MAALTTIVGKIEMVVRGAPEQIVFLNPSKYQTFFSPIMVVNDVLEKLVANILPNIFVCVQHQTKKLIQV